MIRYKKDTDNIVTLTLDMSGRSHNVFNHEIRAAFLPVLQHLQSEKAKGQLNGVIVTSAKRTFLSGGDLQYLFHAEAPEEIFGFVEAMKQFLRALESPGVAVVAAINGNAISAGFELALACHHRIVLDNHQIKLGLPEVEIGLIPGGGSIIRLMWLLGIEKAFPILTSGRRYSPEEALRVGIIDDLARNEKELIQKAKQWLLENKESRRPWDQEDAVIPGGSARDPVTARRIRKLAAQLSAETYNNFAAPQAILNLMVAGSKVDFDVASRIGSRYYTELVRSRQCKNMIKAFWFDQNAINAGLNRPKGYGKFRPKKVGVIGAGTMGSGIALACLRNGMDVVIKDVSKLIAERGREYVDQHLNEALKKGELLPSLKEQYLSKIVTTDRSEDFETCDLVIEAVFENEMVKKKVTRESEQFLDEYAFFATNTISIPITKLSEGSSRPENYIGLHFFHPAETVPLVEIVKGKQTTDETVARAFDFVRSIGKTPIVVKDDWGFYAARVRNTYILEGITMLQEGYSPALIENLGRQAGMPIGALALADDLGLDMVLNYEQQAAAHYGPKYIQHPAVNVLQLMINELGRHGQRKRAGFYNYGPDGRGQLWPQLSEHFPVKSGQSPQEVQERFLFAQVIEAVWCMQEKVLHSVAAANLGSIYGWGFPAFKGGVIQYIQDYGIADFLQQCKRFEQKYGQRFRAPKLVEQVAKEEL